MGGEERGRRGVGDFVGFHGLEFPVEIPGVLDLGCRWCLPSIPVTLMRSLVLSAWSIEAEQEYMCPYQIR